MKVRELRQLLESIPCQDAEAQLVVIIDRVPVAISITRVVDGQDAFLMHAAEGEEIPETDTPDPAYIVGGKPVGAPPSVLFPC